MGLWLLQRVAAALGARRHPHRPRRAARQAAALRRRRRTVFDTDDPPSCPRATCPARIARVVTEGRRAVPAARRPRSARCIVDSLAAGLRRHVSTRGRSSSGTPTSTSCTSSAAGAQNRLLCQLTADRLGLPVLAGPVEATALGNVLVQARTHGADLDLAIWKRCAPTYTDVRARSPGTRPARSRHRCPTADRKGLTMKRQLPKRRTTWRPLMQFKKPTLSPKERRLAKALTIEDLRRIAKRRTPKAAFDYTDGAAEGELSLARARKAFADIEFHPAILRDVSDGRHRVAGARRTGGAAVRDRAHRLHPDDADRGRDRRSPGCRPRRASRSPCPPWAPPRSRTSRPPTPQGRNWFQLYMWKDRDRSMALVDRAARRATTRCWSPSTCRSPGPACATYATA